MKKIITSGLIIFAVFLLSTTRIANAQSGMLETSNQEQQAPSDTDAHAESISAVLTDILKSQGVATVQKLDLSKINDEEWERLGEAAMELHHQGQAHEIMDEMMGGEGSESLRQLHINMGKAYLGDGERDGYGMMGRGMMGNWDDTNSYQRKGGSYTMGNFASNPMGFYGLGFITMILFWGLIIFGAVVLIKWLLNQGNNKTQARSALDIVKERYANGEIDKKEFDEMKKDLK